MIDAAVVLAQGEAPFFTEEQFAALVNRDAMIGVVPVGIDSGRTIQ